MENPWFIDDFPVKTSIYKEGGFPSHVRLPEGIPISNHSRITSLPQHSQFQRPGPRAACCRHLASHFPNMLPAWRSRRSNICEYWDNTPYPARKNAAVWWEKYAGNKMQPTNPHAVAYSCVEHFCETSYLNSLAHFPPVTVQVRCRLWMWNWVECKAQSVKKVECLLGNVVCVCVCVECEVGIVECKVRSAVSKV